MAARVFAAVDIGASGGRVIAGVVDANGPTVTLHTVHRFANGMHEADGHLRWDIGGLYVEVRRGLRALGREFPAVESIGIDTWAVDYALLDAGGSLLADPIAYRDTRTDAAVGRVHELVGADELYEINGLQLLPFTTLYQLDAERRGPIWEGAAHALLLPDLLAYWLTGTMRTEYTNASTTGLVDARRREWSDALFDRLGIPPGLFPPLEQPGTVRGVVTPDVARELDLPATVFVTTVGSHDTASAVVGVPASGADFAYVASGTWSLVGLELDEPVITAASRAANFTNEGGVDGRTRFLRNVGGLWLLQESMRAWAADGVEHDLARLLDDAAVLPSGGPTVDVDDPDVHPARRHAAANPRRGRPGGRGPARHAGGDHRLHRRVARRGLRPYRRRRVTAGGTPRRHDPHRRRRGPERAALSTDRHVVGRPGRRRPGRGDRARQRVCPGDGGGRAARRPRRGPAPHRPEPRPGSRSGRLRAR